nr:ATP-binding protein [Bacteroidota bacterium]
MVFKRYFIFLIARITLLVINIFFLVYFLITPNYYYTIIVLALLFLIQAFSLLYFTNQPNRLAAKFLAQLDGDVVSDTFTDSKGYSGWPELKLFLNRMHEILAKKNAQNEKQRLMLEYLLDNVGAGIVIFDGHGRVKMKNNALQQMLGKIPVHINSFEDMKPGLSEILNQLEPRHPETLLLNQNHQLRKFALKCSIIKMDNQALKLVSFTDIHAEMQEGQIEAWQKLLRVMMHEVMNSLTPISGISSSLKRSIHQDGKLININEISEETLQTLFSGLDLLEERGEVLHNFVKKYRSLVVNKKPEIEAIQLCELLDTIVLLFSEQAHRIGVRIKSVVVPEDMVLETDERFLQQVLINLVKNAIEAMPGNKSPEVELSGKMTENGETWITVSDNGQGMTSAELEQVFVPFYSTRENGSGIGLSLSRQIVTALKGSIEIRSTKDKGTVVTIKF